MTASKTPWIRPAWTPVTIAMMVFGFILHPVLGLAMLAYIIWGDKLEGMSSDIRSATDDLAEKFNRGKSQDGGFTRASRTGNAAFDDWREQEIDRLRKERERLDEEREEFEDYMREARRSKDEEEFETFRRSRGTTSKGKKSRKSSVPDA